MPGAIPGPPPKPADQRARRNKDTVKTTEVRFVRADQPELSPHVEWHPETHKWWAMWGRSPLTDLFTEADWTALAETALFHSALWNGDLKAGAELRLRVAKFGMTPEDRARLRITFAGADKAEREAPTASAPTPSSAGGAYGGLSLVD